MKKLLSLLLVLATIISMVCIPVTADDTSYAVSYTASVSEVTPGQEFTIDAVFNNIENVTAYQISVVTEKGKVSVTNDAQYISTARNFMYDVQNGCEVIVGYSTPITLNGAHVRFFFKVDDDNTSDLEFSFITQIDVGDGAEPIASENLILKQHCDHALSFVAEAASTCTVQGTKAHYVCSR